MISTPLTGKLRTLTPEQLAGVVDDVLHVQQRVVGHLLRFGHGVPGGIELRTALMVEQSHLELLRAALRRPA